MQKIKYITNRDLLAEIKLCKAAFCHFSLPEYATYDAIVTDIVLITPELVLETINIKANRLSSKTIPVDPATIPPCSIVFRVMTDGHLPPVDEKKRRRSGSGELIKTNFNPFRHFILQDDGVLTEVGRSHWRGNLETGAFSVEHGKISNRLAMMFMLLVEQYSRRGNWRGYCVSEFDQALSQRGWVGMDEINEDDLILSYDQGTLKWSNIESIYRSQYDGEMFHITGQNIDALVTPGHKFVTGEGLTRVEYLKESDRLLLMGKAVEDIQGQTFQYSDAFVELVGWFVTEGNCYSEECRNYVRIAIFQNDGEKADRIRQCLITLNVNFGETRRPSRQEDNRNTQLVFTIGKELCNRLLAVAQDKILSPSFIIALSSSQRMMLINTMIDGDGFRRKTDGGMIYAQKNPAHIETFLMLCTISGYKTSVRHVEAVSFGKPVSYFLVTLLASKSHIAQVSSLDFHGAKRKARSEKINHPNEPTVPYSGRVWCPKTQYGTFVTRRNNVIYVTGQTYIDEMRSHALVQLAQVGLQFDESRSDNPFAFFTQIIKNCLAGDTMILTREFGSVLIEQIAEQDVTLLDGNGDWIKCHIYDYGVQETINLNFYDGHSTTSIRSTIDHGWVQKDTGERIDTRHFIEDSGFATKDIFIDDLLKKDNKWQIRPGDQNFERRMERVYCPDVQTTHTMALGCGIHSFQCFRRILNLERRNQDIRDDLLIMAGAMPSYTRQVDNEIDQRDAAEVGSAGDKPARRGRKPKAQLDRN